MIADILSSREALKIVVDLFLLAQHSLIEFFLKL
jgi:hypothetical protein